MTATAPTISTAPSPIAFVAGLALAAAIGLGAGFTLHGAIAEAAPAPGVQPADQGTVDPGTRQGPRQRSGTYTEAPLWRYTISSEPQLE